MIPENDDNCHVSLRVHLVTAELCYNLTGTGTGKGKVAGARLGTESDTDELVSP